MLDVAKIASSNQWDVLGEVTRFTPNWWTFSNVLVVGDDTLFGETVTTSEGQLTRIHLTYGSQHSRDFRGGWWFEVPDYLLGDDGAPRSMGKYNGAVAVARSWNETEPWVCTRVTRVSPPQELGLTGRVVSCKLDPRHRVSHQSPFWWRHRDILDIVWLVPAKRRHTVAPVVSIELTSSPT